MVSAMRQARRDRQVKHIPSPNVWDSTSRQWIKNPEIKKKVKKSAPTSGINKENKVTARSSRKQD